MKKTIDHKWEYGLGDFLRNKRKYGIVPAIREDIYQTKRDFRDIKRDIENGLLIGGALAALTMVLPIVISKAIYRSYIAPKIFAREKESKLAEN